MRHANGQVSTADLRLNMQKTMQTHAAVFRDGPTLEAGCRKMSDLYKELVCGLGSWTSRQWLFFSSTIACLGFFLADW